MQSEAAIRSPPPADGVSVRRGTSRAMTVEAGALAFSHHGFDF